MSQKPNLELEKKIVGVLETLRSKDDLAKLFCSVLGFQYLGRSLSAKSKDIWGEGAVADIASDASFEVLAQHGNVGAGGFAILYGEIRPFNLSAERAIIAQLRKTFPDALFLFADPKSLGSERGAKVHLAHAKLSGIADDAERGQRLVVRRFRFGPGGRYRTTAERLAKLDISGRPEVNTSELAAICKEAFDKEALTDEFFKKLDVHIRAVETDLARHQKLDPRDAFTEAQLLIERLVFLYFAQNRGWLDQRSDYLINAFQKYVRDPNGHGYYQEFLHRLFRSLSEPPPHPGDRLAGIPFLNGGLFDDDEFKPEASKLCIRNATFAALFEDLLEAYNFTVREDTPLSQEVAVDPEMLGKIFESIVLHAESAGEEFQAPDKRKATGSYYTPRIVVHFICRETLRLYFAGRAGQLADANARDTWAARISRLFKGIEPDDGFNEAELKALREILTPTEAKRCVELLKSLRTLDPAVGSGAFPVGLLHELVSLLRIFETVAGGYRDPVTGEGSTWIQEAKEHFIQHSLFGVDIQQQAIEICRLRLWLSLLVDYELGVNPFEAERSRFIEAIGRISQLPNLEMNFKRGDSLHDYICGHPVRLDLKTSEYLGDLERIEKLGLQLHKAKRAETKKKLRLEILERRIALGQRVVNDQISRLQKKAAEVADVWFGQSESEAAKERKITAEIVHLKEALKQLDRDEKELKRLQARPLEKDFYRHLRELEGAQPDGPHNFVWRLDFPHVLTGKSAETLAGEMALVNEAQAQQEMLAPPLTPHPSTLNQCSGFDILVGNPPFVTARNPVKRELYRERWPRVCHMKFLLVCPFFELSFGLLKPDGQLGFIVSNAFAKREFGKPLVEGFFPTVDLQKVVDCSGLLFPGHGTPTCLAFGAQRKPNEKLPILVAAILPGGGDLRTSPEESPLWYTLAANHDNPGFSSNQVVVADRERNNMARWPWNFDVGPEPTRRLLQESGSAVLRDFLATDIGFMFIIGRNDIFMLPPDVLRRHQITGALVRRIHPGEEIRDYTLRGQEFVIFPYRPGTLELVKFPKHSPERKYFAAFTQELSERPTFSGTFAEEGREPYEFHQLPIERAKNPNSIVFAEITTHGHFLFDPDGCAFNQKGPLLKLRPNASPQDHHLIAGLLNTSGALFWLKQLCFNKGAGEDEHRDRFEYAGGKVQQLPIPRPIAEGLGGKAHLLAEQLTELSRGCWERGRELPSLAMRKLFEKSGEAYHAWNAALPGYIPPHAQLQPPFASTADLGARFARAEAHRDQLRAEMVARQEEMDWLVYSAYGLIPADCPAARVGAEPAPLDQAQRPFRLWESAEGDFERAAKLIPADWSKPRHQLWEARLAAIRDNEHVRRIEQPVYKRRWDEQWKVSNRWMAGPVAYAAEFEEAFRWWLAEKAEWHLENKADGGPLDLATWTAALWKDARVQAAWPVVADAILTVAQWKFGNAKDKDGKKPPGLDASERAFARYFKQLATDESVPEGIPPATAWDDLAAKKKWTSAQLKKTQAVRGKLNVPRERFRVTAEGAFVWAGKA